MKKQSILLVLLFILGIIILSSCKEIADPDGVNGKGLSNKHEFRKIDTAYSFIPVSGKTLWSFIPNSINRYSWYDQVVDCGFRWISAWSGCTDQGMPPANPSFYGNEYQTAFDAFYGTGYNSQVVMRLSGNGGNYNQPQDIYDNYNYAWMEKMIDHFNSNSGVIGWEVDEPFECIKYTYFDISQHSPPTVADRAMIDTVFYRLVRLANRAYQKKLLIATACKPSFGLAWDKRDTQNGTYRYWYQRLLDTCSNIEIWPEAYGKQLNSPGGPNDWISGADVTQDYYNSYSSYTGRMGFFINVHEVSGYSQDPDVNSEYNWNHVMDFMNQHGVAKLGIWGCNVTGATVNKFCDAAKYYNFLEYNP
jgi:hypothetical protein